MHLAGPEAAAGHRTTAVVGAAIFYVGDSSEDHSLNNSFADSTLSCGSSINIDGADCHDTVVPTTEWPPADDTDAVVCNGVLGRHNNYQNQIHLPDQDNHHHREEEAAAATAAEEEEETIKRRLKFFFMNPLEKYKAGRGVPWKLLLQALKVVLVTTQLAAFANLRFAHVNYVSGQTIALQHLFIKVRVPVGEKGVVVVSFHVLENRELAPFSVKKNPKNVIYSTFC